MLDDQKLSKIITIFLVVLLFIQLGSLDPFLNWDGESRGDLCSVNLKDLMDQQYSSLIFTGDIMLARHVEYLTRQFGIDYPFSRIDLTNLSEEPAVIGNFEAAVPNNHVRTPPYTYRFSVATGSLATLQRAHFTHVSLANNHSGDFGSAGLEHTVEQIKLNKIVPFGWSREKTVYIKVSNEVVSLVGLNAVDTSFEQAVAVEKILEAAKHSHRQIVYVHWGEEYQTKATEYQRQLARAFIAAGADIIIGHHPHVVQDAEVINGVPVVYSLGNFIFDQYFSKEVQRGALAVVDFTTTTEPTFSLRGITSTDALSQPRLMSEREEQRLVEAISDLEDNKIPATLFSKGFSLPPVSCI